MDYAPFTLAYSTQPGCFLFSQEKIGTKSSTQETHMKASSDFTSYLSEMAV